MKGTIMKGTITTETGLTVFRKIEPTTFNAIVRALRLSRKAKKRIDCFHIKWKEKEVRG